ncbi:helix-turn-helix domain-containing protein [Pseudomonas rhodesiae]|uniref:helix-turn-helix domain-containing protein n=1 Tax=Pseudomonas rhodesiae TaxID=76760 RepID=UPI000F486E67
MNPIAEFREEAGITQPALHQKLNWKQSRLANYESGARPLKLEDAWKIVKSLNELGAKCTLDRVFPQQSSAYVRAAYRRTYELSIGSVCISCGDTQESILRAQGWKTGGAFDAGHFLGKGARPEQMLF